MTTNKLDIDTLDYSELDPNIRETVRLLRRAGFDTTDSSDGATHRYMSADIDFPYVCVHTSPEDMVNASRKIKPLLESVGVSFSIPQSQDHAGPTIEASYSPVDGVAVVMVNFVVDSEWMR